MDKDSADRGTGPDRTTGSGSQRQELERLPVEEHLRVSVVDANDLPPIWDEVAELLGPACERSFGQETIETLRASLISGNEGLFVIETLDDIIGAVTYEVVTYNTGLRVLAINYAGGVAMAWIPGLAAVVALAAVARRNRSVSRTASRRRLRVVDQSAGRQRDLHGAPDHRALCALLD